MKPRGTGALKGGGEGWRDRTKDLHYSRSGGGKGQVRDAKHGVLFRETDGVTSGGMASSQLIMWGKKVAAEDGPPIHMEKETSLTEKGSARHEAGTTTRGNRSRRSKKGTLERLKTVTFKRDRRKGGKCAVKGESIV